MGYILNDTVGKNIQFLTYNMKAIEARIEFTKSLEKLLPKDRHKINIAISKVKQAILDVAMICKRHDVVGQIMQDLVDAERMSLYLALTEQLYDLTTEDLEQVTDILEERARQNYEAKQAETVTEEPSL